MKTNITLLSILSTLTLIFLFLAATPAYSQSIQFDTKQNLVISSPGFFPFAGVSNNIFKDAFSTDPNLTVQFSNFLGSPCNIAPAADSSEVGPKIRVTGSGEFVIDFGEAPPNRNIFGLSFVPETGGTCIFDIFVKSPLVTTSSTSGGITGPGETFTPNGLTVFGGYLSDSLTSQLSNEMSNPNCQNSPFGINTLTINGQGGNDTFNLVIDELGVPKISINPPERVLNQVTPSKKESFSFIVPENKNAAMAVYNQKLVNKTDTTKIYVTGIFPSLSEINPTMVGRVFSPDIEVTLKDQINPALAAVQHAIVSATMPWQLSKPNGFFITQGGGCVGPFCVIVEQGMIVVDPDGACTPEKLNKRRAGYKTFNPSKFFDPFPVASQTIQIPASSIVDPKHPLVSKIVRDNAYLILQPVPPGGKLVQQLKFDLKNKKN